MPVHTSFSYQRQYAVVQKANGSNCVLRKYTVTAVCRAVIAVCALIKTMICFSSDRSRSANVVLMLGQCNRRQDNIKNVHCGVPGVFASGDDALSPVDVITGCDDVLVALPYIAG